MIIKPNIVNPVARAMARRVVVNASIGPRATSTSATTTSMRMISMSSNPAQPDRASLPIRCAATPGRNADW